MDAAPDTRRQLGQLMVEEGLLSAEELAHALREQSETGKPLGETLVALGYVSPGAVANALAEQHGGLLRTEFGVSTGLRAVPGEAPALNGAPPVAPLTAHESPDHVPKSSAPLGLGLRLARPAGSPAPLEAPPVAAAPMPVVPPEPAPTPEAAPAPGAEDEAVELAKFASLHTDLEAARTELEQKSARLTEVTGRLDDTVTQLRASQAARDAFAAKAADLQAQIEAGTEPDPAEAARVRELEQSVADLQSRLAEAVEAVAGAQQDPAEAARAEELGQRVEELTSAVEAAEVRARAFEAELHAADAARAALVENVNDLQAKLAEAEAPAPPDPELTARVQDLEAQLQAVATERDGLTQHVVQLQEEAAAPTEPDPALLARIQDLEAQAQAIAAERDAQAESVAILRARLAEPDPGVAARIEELEAQLQLAAADRDMLTQNVTDLQEKLIEAELPAPPDPELTARVQELEAELAARDAEPAVVAPDPAHVARVHELEAQLQASCVERDSLVQSLTELQSRLGATAQAREDEVSRANAVAAARVTVVESQLQEAENARNALAQSFEELQGLLGQTTVAHNSALDKLEEQLAEREQRLAGRADEIAAVDREHQAALDRMNLEHDVLAERFEKQLAERDQRLAELAQELEQAQARITEQAAAVAEPEESVHVLLVPAFTGYMLLERSGPAPDAHAVVEIGPGTWGEGRFVVSRIGPSPLPGGPKRCAFLELA